MEEITLKLTIEEANTILEGLGELPFKRVFNLVGKIQQQASTQFNGNGAQITENLRQVEMEEKENKP
jgi:hypothetical protein